MGSINMGTILLFLAQEPLSMTEAKQNISTSCTHGAQNVGVLTYFSRKLF